MIYQVSEKNMEKIKNVLHEEWAFVGRFRKENKEELVEIYNFLPSTIILYKDQIEIISKLTVSDLYSKSKLEEKAEIELEEIKQNGN